MNKSDVKKIINTIDIIEARLRYNVNFNSNIIVLYIFLLVKLLILSLLIKSH